MEENTEIVVVLFCMHLCAIGFPLLSLSDLMYAPSCGVLPLKHVGAHHATICPGPVICRGAVCPGARGVKEGVWHKPFHGGLYLWGAVSSTETLNAFVKDTAGTQYPSSAESSLSSNGLDTASL